MNAYNIQGSCSHWFTDTQVWQLLAYMLRLSNDHAVNVIANPRKKVLFSSLLHHAYFVVWCCFCCAGDAHIAALSQVFTHPSKTSGINKLELRYVDVIVIIFIYMY